jgi:hypothetical protein
VRADVLERSINLRGGELHRAEVLQSMNSKSSASCSRGTSTGASAPPVAAVHWLARRYAGSGP